MPDLAADPAAPPPSEDLAAIANLEAQLLAQIHPATAIASILVWRASVLTVRLDRLSVHEAAMTARRVRYARVGRENERWAEVIAVARTLVHDPTEAVRKLRQTPEGFDWLIREWDLLEAEVAAGLDPLPEARTVYERAQLFLGLHTVEQDGGEWATRCKALETPSFQTTPEEDRDHRDWVAAWAAAQAEALRKERAKLDHAAEEEDKEQAAARALFDPGTDAERARRYEAASDRSFLRTIKELDRIQAQAAKAGAAGRQRTQPPVASPDANEPTGGPRPAATPVVPATAIAAGAAHP